MSRRWIQTIGASFGPGPGRGAWAAAGVFLVAQILFICHGVWSGDAAWALKQLPLDDAWIHLAYARNLLHYGYFTYNPGEIETGATSPLWVVTLALGLAVLRNPVLTAKVLGIALGAAAAAAGYLELRRLSGSVAAWVGVLCLAATPRWLMGTASGMEIPLTAFLLILALRQASLGRPGRTGLMLGLLVLARPDMAPPALAGGLVLLASLPGERANWRGRLRAGALCAAVAIVTAGGWFIYCRLGTGHWLPTTFYAKADRSTPFDLSEKLRIMGWMLEHHFWPAPLLHDPAFLGLLVAGIVVAFAALRRQPVLAAWPLIPLLHIAGWSMISINVAHDSHAGQYLTFFFDRYYLPAYPLVFGVIGLGAGALAGGLRWLGARLQTGLAPRADRTVRWALAALLPVALVTGNACGWWTRIGPLWQLGEGLRTEWRTTALYNSRACRSIDELQVRSSHWVAAHLPPGATIATQDAGAIRYFIPNPLVDLAGLNSHPFLFAPDKPAWLRQHQVRYAVLFPNTNFTPFYDFQTRPLERFVSEGNKIAVGDTVEVYELLN